MIRFLREVWFTLTKGERVVHPGTHWIIRYLKEIEWEPTRSYLPENKAKPTS